MTALRGLAAILVGVVVAALVDAALLTVLDLGSPAPIADKLSAIPLLAVLGLFFAAPSWALFCLLLLPVATRRARTGRPLPTATLLVIAAALGAALLIPNMVLLIGSAPGAVPAYALMGAVGGLCLATAWKWLVLDRPRRALGSAG